MIYLDDGATSFYKPPTVEKAMIRALRSCTNPGRGGYPMANNAARIVYGCRCAAGEMFDCAPEQVVFTKNCTEALNVAIFGYLKKGAHVITTVFEHNSVLRPLFYLEKQGVITLDVVAPDKNGQIESEIEKAITKNTRLIVTTAVSNVNGQSLPVKEIGAIAKKRGISYLIDGAQGGGHVDLKIGDGVSAIALAGHKGLCGIMGSGTLVLSDDFDVEPLLYGGTGSESFNPLQPDCYPEKLEAGTLNLPAIASLNEGVIYASANLEHFAKQLVFRTQSLIEHLQSINGVKCYSSPNAGGIVAFSLENLSSEVCAEILNERYDIAVRGGIHCAPLMHRYLNTQDCGLVRASIAVQNSSSELNYLISAIKEISNKN